MNHMLLEWPSELLDQRSFLYSLAKLQLGHTGDAEDAVQETLLAAAQSWSSYCGERSLRAWLTGILKHKIIDAIRKHQLRDFVPLPEDDVLTESSLGFTAEGQWDTTYFLSTSCPEDHVSSRELLDLVEICLQNLPARSARMLLMREYLGFETQEICQQASMNPGQLRVILHRARLQLRSCVVRGWTELR